MTDYKDLFFDLDGTLWDFRANSEDTQLELYHHFHLDRYFSDFETMVARFMDLNDRLWHAYREGLIDRDRLKWYRFALLLGKAGVHDISLAREMDRYYLSRIPLKTKLIPGTMDVLPYLQRSYNLHIITNGFNEVQLSKIENSGLISYFKTITTAEDAGHLKPDVHIFESALAHARTEACHSIMIGDQYEVDVLGARHAGIDQVYLATQETPPERIESTYQINDLRQLMDIF